MATQPSVRLTLEPRKDGRTFGLELTFANTGKERAYIEKYNACADGGIEQDVFQVETERGERIDFTAALYKRGRAGEKDYVMIPAGERFVTTVDLAEAYRLLPGTHTYRVKYSAFVAYPDRDGFWSLESANSATAAVTSVTRR